MHTTPGTLLDRLRNAPDDAIWRQLVQLYTPLLFAWARGAGEQEHDAADLVQDVFAILVKSLPDFHRQRKGSFRLWLRTITLNKLRERHHREARMATRTLDPGAEPPLPDNAETFWDREYEQALSRRALELMQTDFSPKTWKACWEFVANGRPAAEVARELGISENAVYLAKCRVLSRLRQSLLGLID